MAGEWIKVEHATPDKPEVLRMSRILGIEKDAVFGKLIRLWAWFDRITVDGVVDGVVSTDVDAIVYQEGFVNALQSVGWCSYDDLQERITLLHFDRHNGETAKKRALKNRRQANYRKGLADKDIEEYGTNKLKKSDSNVDTQESTEASTEASTREEKRREDNKDKELSINKHTFIDSKKVSTDEIKPKKTRIQTKLVEEIFSDWQEVTGHHRSGLGTKRAQLIRDAVRMGYDRQSLRQAFIGCIRSSFHAGYNENGKVYTDIELILRNEKNIDRFRQYAKTPPKPTFNPDDKSQLSVRQAAAEFWESACRHAKGEDNSEGVVIDQKAQTTQLRIAK